MEGIVRAQVPSSSLISLADARIALAQATDVGAVATLVDRLEVVRLAARKARLSLEAQNDWATLKLEAERKAGGMLTELRRAGELHAGRPNNADNVAAFLSGFGISQHQSSRTYRRPGVGSSGERASGRGALTHLGPGRPARRNGYDRIIEVYPAAALHEWRYLSDHYKGTRGAAARARIVQKLGAAIPGLDAVTEECAASDHLLDAVVAALVARAYQIRRSTGRTPAQATLAPAEGWIWLPDIAPEQLAVAT